MTIKTRIVEFDWLRIFLAFVGILYHVSLCFSEFRISNANTFSLGYNLPGLDWLEYFIHSCRMQIFFFLSGLFFTVNLERNIQATLISAGRRILFPFFIFSLLVLPVTFVLINQLPFHRSPDYMWFLEYLFLFYLVCYVFEWFLCQIKNQGIRIPDRPSDRDRLLLGVLVLGLITLVFMFSSLKPPAPGVSWVPKPKTFVVYFLYFLLGLCFEKQMFIQWSNRFRKHYALAVFFFFVAMITLTKDSDNIFRPAKSLLVALWPLVVTLFLIKVFQFISKTCWKPPFEISYLRIYLLHKPVLLILIFNLSLLGLSEWTLFFWTVFLTSFIVLNLEIFIKIRGRFV